MERPHGQTAAMRLWLRLVAGPVVASPATVSTVRKRAPPSAPAPAWLSEKLTPQRLSVFGIPALVADKPWEKVAVMCPDVMWDDAAKLYRMWYSGGEQYEPDAIGYATSPDGLTWTKHGSNPVFGTD